MTNSEDIGAPDSSHKLKLPLIIINIEQLLAKEDLCDHTLKAIHQLIRNDIEYKINHFNELLLNSLPQKI